MLESFGERKYTAKGVIQWMLNNAWPGMIWHLYDFYLRPGGSYFGAKKAGEPLHVQYAYDDRSVVVVNSTLEAYAGLKATVRVLDTSSKEHHRETSGPFDVAPDSSLEVLKVKEPAGLTATYLLFLTLEDAAGLTVSRNVYWLSTKPDALDWDKSEWYVTPQSRYADLTGLERLPAATVKARAAFETSGPRGRARVTLENGEGALAFLVHLAVRKGAGGEEVLPVLWEDNYVTLAPGERLDLAATWAAKDLGGAKPVVAIDGWNVQEALAAQ
jgi:exo-1,4-beta-D-glucosaminidase